MKQTFIFLSMLLLTPLATLHAADAPAPMPTYHFTSPTVKDYSPFDPNGAIYFNGRYHLGYIAQMDDIEGDGKHFWGHVSSADLIHWQMHPPILSPGPEGGIYSGNAFIDKKGRVVLSYLGTKVSSMCLAIAEDKDLDVFKKHEANPVIKKVWDPHCWVENDIYYAIGSGYAKRAVPLYTCSDDSLTNWTPVGPFFTHEMADVYVTEDLSCPDFFKLGDKHVLLGISHIRGARYYVGSFDGKQFRPEAHYRMNWPGGTCFAPESLVDAKGRRIMWAWVVGSPSTMSLPRVLSMESDGILHINPPEELNTLRTRAQALKEQAVPSDSTVVAEGIRGDCKELHVIMDPQQAAQCGVKVRCSSDGTEETVIAYEPSRKTLRIEMSKSSLDKKRMPRAYVMPWVFNPKGIENPVVSFQEAPFELKVGELLDLRIYLDHSILEVFANGRQCITQRIYPTRHDSVGVAFFARSGAAKVASLEAWDMNPTTLTSLPKTAN